MLALSLAPLSTSCGSDRARLALPPADRAAQVARPTPPAGNSDAEVGQFIAQQDAALTEANRRLAWLFDWITAAGK